MCGKVHPPPCDIYDQMTSNVVANLFHKYLGTILRAVLKNKGSANRPKWTNLKIFIIYCTKSKLKGGQFIEKMPTFVFWAPYCGPFWTYLGVCQSAHNGPIWNFFNFYLHKIRIKRGSVSWKKLQSHVIRAPCGRLFWSNAWLPTGQIWADQFFFW